MPPSRGQPWMPNAIEFSLGDPFAAPGTDAYEGMIINPVAPDVPPSFVFSLAMSPTFDLTVFLRLSATAAHMASYNPIIVGFCQVQFRFQNVDTGVFLPPVPAGPIAVIVPPPGGAPAGATPAFVGGFLRWYSAAAIATPTPAVGTYRLLTHVAGVGPFAASVNIYHETYFTVTL